MKKIIIGAIGLILAVIIGILVWYNVSLSPVSSKKVEENEVIRVEIEKGLGTNQIAKVLEKKDIIRSAAAMKIYTSLNDVKALQAGVYDLNNSEDMATILNRIANGEVVSDEVKITFIEGKNIRWIAKTIASKTNNTEQDVFDLLEDEEYINELVEKYWFLTDEIKDDRIYYPLEGYLLPDTYIFENKDVSVKTIFNVILNFTDKYLTKFKDQFDNNSMTIHQLITMASLAELEGKKIEDRKEIIGVFYNRLVTKMSLGSDVTTYYAFKVDMGDRDLTVKELNTENPYNTRGPNMGGKLPIGPISSVSKNSIEASLPTIKVKTNIAVDNERPSDVKNLKVSKNKIPTSTISWDKSTDNKGVIGYKIYVNGEYWFDTGERKIIPAGTYKVAFRKDQGCYKTGRNDWLKNGAEGKPNYRFAKYSNGFVPLVMNVPGRGGIRIHQGTSVAWSEGCLITGIFNNGKLVNSWECWKRADYPLLCAVKSA